MVLWIIFTAQPCCRSILWASTVKLSFLLQLLKILVYVTVSVQRIISQFIYSEEAISLITLVVEWPCRSTISTHWWELVFVLNTHTPHWSRVTL